MTEGDAATPSASKQFRNGRFVTGQSLCSQEARWCATCAQSSIAA